MSVSEIEELLLLVKSQVEDNTANINYIRTVVESIHNSISNYATTDDLTAIATNVNVLQNNNILLQDQVAALQNNIESINHLSRLKDVKLKNITENDVLMYGNDGLWHNIKIEEIKITGTGAGGSSTLEGLTDVFISGVSNGQVLAYNSINKKWTNVDPQTNNQNISLKDYLTIKDAELLYLPLTGGTISGNLVVNGMTTINNDLLVKGGITMYKN